MADESRDDLRGTTADAPQKGSETRHAGGRDAIDRARDEEVQEHENMDGAAFPNPGGGAVVGTDPAEDAQDPALSHPDDGLGAGDALRGGGSGPVPPGTARRRPEDDAKK